MHKTISIIIPTYNMEAYLAKCLGSLVLADRPERVQALVVNDGSKDGSLQIARGFQEEHPEVFEIIDKPNGNYGSCINAALPQVQGKYVKVLDADDYFDNGVFGEFVDLLDNLDADLVLTGKLNLTAKGIYETFCDYPADVVFDFFKGNNHRKLRSIMMHNVCYRTALFDGLDYHQTEGISYTDNEWITLPFYYVRTAYHFRRPLYSYLLCREGQSVDPKVAAKHIKDDVLVTMAMVRHRVQAAGAAPATRRLMTDHLRHRLLWLYKRVLLLNPTVDARVLIPLDETLKDLAPDLYEAIGTKLTSSPFLRPHYIRRWRDKGYPRTLGRLSLYYLVKRHYLNIN